ncbi:MAG: hypothetical protein ACFCU7_14815 [Pleurocapsa sp.]
MQWHYDYYYIYGLIERNLVRDLTKYFAKAKPSQAYPKSDRLYYRVSRAIIFLK